MNTLSCFGLAYRCPQELFRHRSIACSRQKMGSPELCMVLQTQNSSFFIHEAGDIPIVFNFFSKCTIYSKKEELSEGVTSL